MAVESRSYKVWARVERCQENGEYIDLGEPVCLGTFSDVAEAAELVDRLSEDGPCFAADDEYMEAHAHCGTCGAGLGPTEEYPWHYPEEDCRAVRAAPLLCPKCGAGVSDCATDGCGVDPNDEGEA